MLALILPEIFCVPRDKLEFKLIPLPNKFFSLIAVETTLPSLPTPTPALIVPVGCSSTTISRLTFSLFNSLVLIFISLKIPNTLRLSNDFSNL